MRSFLFLCGEFFGSLSRNRFLHLTYGTQVTISLLVLGIFFVLLVGAATAWNSIGTNLKIHVFLDDSLSAQEINMMEKNLKEIPHVASIMYRSKEEARELFQESNPSINISELMDDNPLPASFIIKAEHPNQMEEIAGQIKAFNGIDTIRYGAQVLKNYLKVLTILVIICIVTISLLIVFTTSSISNIIGMSIYARRTEIRIMQLVGATWWFIRWPFLIEGLFFGVIGATIAWAIIFAILAMLAEAFRLTELTLALPFIKLDATGIYAGLAILLGGLGGLVGFFGSLKTVNTFLGRETEIQLDALRVKQLVR